MSEQSIQREKFFFFCITQMPQMSMGTPSTPEAPLHKEVSLNEEPTMSQATWVAQQCHPGKINSLQLEKTIGSRPCWQIAVCVCTQEDFLSAGACSPVRKDGCISRGTGKKKLSSAPPRITKQHRRKTSSRDLVWNEAVTAMTRLSLGSKTQDYLSLRYVHDLECVK